MEQVSVHRHERTDASDNVTGNEMPLCLLLSHTGHSKAGVLSTEHFTERGSMWPSVPGNPPWWAHRTYQRLSLFPTPQGPLLEKCDLNQVVSDAITMSAKAQQDSDSDKELLVSLA